MVKKKAKQAALGTAGGSSVGLYLTGIVAVVAVVAVVIMILNVKGVAMSSSDGITGMAIKGSGTADPVKCRKLATTMVPSANPRTGQRAKFTPVFDSAKYKACLQAGKAGKMARVTQSAREGSLGTNSRVQVVDAYDAYKRR